MCEVKSTRESNVCRPTISRFRSFKRTATAVQMPGKWKLSRLRSFLESLRPTISFKSSNKRGDFASISPIYLDHVNSWNSLSGALRKEVGSARLQSAVHSSSIRLNTLWTTTPHKPWWAMTALAMVSILPLASARPKRFREGSTEQVYGGSRLGEDTIDYLKFNVQPSSE